MKNSRNRHEILLYGYIKEELQQRIWGRGLSWEGPIGFCSVIPGAWAQQPGKVGLLLGVESCRITVL